MLLGQALPEAAAFVRKHHNGPNAPGLGWERAGLFASVLVLCFWASRFKARTVYDVTPSVCKPASTNGSVHKRPTIEGEREVVLRVAQRP